MSRVMPAVALCAAFLAAGAVRAAAPPETVTAQSPLDTEKVMGRWYEILRTPNKLQRNCYAAYQVWSRKGDAYAIEQVCHRDAPDGRVAAVTVAARPLNPPANTVFEASFLGGLIHQTYVLADHAPDYSWLIATTADGRYPKLLARAPGLPMAEQEALKQRMARMGFNVARLEECAASPAS